MNPSDHDESRLPTEVESLLVEWPVREDPAFEDRNAEAVQARLLEVEAGSTSSDLLAAPLPATDDDGTLPADSATAAEALPASSPAPRSTPASQPTPSRPAPSAPPTSLADLARASLAESKKSADDVSDIARETLSVASQSRTSAPDIAAMLASRPSRTSVPPSSAPAPANQSQPPQQVAAAPPRRNSGPLVAAGVAVLGLAAAVAIFLHGHSQSASLPTQAEVQAPAQAAAAPAKPAASVAAQAKPTNDEKGVVSLDQLPSDKPASSPGVAVASAPHAADRAKAHAENAAEAKAEATVHLSSDEPKKTAGEKSVPGMKLADGTTTGGLPDKPTTGQVSVAVGAVLGSARACVAGQEAPSRAVIVFGSDGRVKSVSVSGPAAGTPAAGCIRAALSQARLQPFARSTFSVGTPIRPE